MAIPPKISGTREWSTHSDNICTGCEHGCRYCYAAYNAVDRFHRVASYDEWMKMQVRPADVKRKVHKVQGRVMFPTTHDITPSILEPCIGQIMKHLNVGNQLLIVSKPHTECIREILRHLRMWDDAVAPINLERRIGRIAPSRDDAAAMSDVLFRFTIGADADEILKIWEPGAPSFGDRLRSLRMCANCGYGTSVSVEPMLDFPNVTRLFWKLEPWVSDGIWIGKMNKMDRRVQLTVPLAARNHVLAGQTDANYKALYGVLGHHPKIRWKEGVKDILGLALPTKAGEDK